MFNNVVLDVFIGLAFIYLIYSLLATTLQEVMARWLGLRGRMLQKSIRRMLEDEQQENIFGAHRRVSVVLNALSEIIMLGVRFVNPFYQSQNKFTRSFFDYPSIRYLAESSWNSKPSYISAANFSQTIVQLLRGPVYDGATPQMKLIYDALFVNKQFQDIGGGMVSIDRETLRQLQQQFRDAQNDIGRFKDLLEQWFNDTQDRASGWYKKQTQLLLFLVGFAVAWLFNVDTIAIYRTLSKDKGIRDQIVTMAISAPAKYGPYVDSLKKAATRDSMVVKRKDKKDTVIYTNTTQYLVSDSLLQKTYRSLQADADKTSQLMGLGRIPDDTCKRCDSIKLINSSVERLMDSVSRHKLDSARKFCATYKTSRKWLQYSPNQDGGWTTLLGWLLTAIAVSLGAPFWFDLLNKFVQLRGSGPKPQGDTAAAKNTAGNTAPASSPTQRIG